LSAESRGQLETTSPGGEAAADAALLERAPERVEHPLGVNGNGDLAALVPGLEHTRLERVLKRGFDVVGATLLLILLSPLLIAIAIMVKIDSPGPILFRHPRVGRDGEWLWMRKFRTMIKDADAHKLRLLHMNEAAEGLFKIREDPRVTRFGRFLRSTSLDELPQLFHVLTGKMSLVGPRPLVPDEDAKIQGEYRRRLEIRPGMTGVWQVQGASEIPIREMVRLDLAYVRDWSLWGDLKLLAGTAAHVVQRRGI
jgi:lipopolysaccharide/colanic/teichoic acid biosynthesis glycosyltransferase